MNGITLKVCTLLSTMAFGLAPIASARSAEATAEALVALETLLHGEWDGLGPCDGEIAFRADGTYDWRYIGPGGDSRAGTWDVRWDALPPTLVLTCETSDKGHVGKPFEVKLVELNEEALVFGYSEKMRARYERPKAIDEARATEIAKILIANKETWADRAEYAAKRTGEGWSIMVWRLPKTPGGHRMITLTREGKLAKYMRGR